VSDSAGVALACRGIIGWDRLFDEWSSRIIIVILWASAADVDS
jgi:hypothetical protein